MSIRQNPMHQFLFNDVFSVLVFPKQGIVHIECLTSSTVLQIYAECLDSAPTRCRINHYTQAPNYYALVMQCKNILAEYEISKL